MPSDMRRVRVAPSPGSDFSIASGLSRVMAEPCFAWTERGKGRATANDWQELSLSPVGRGRRVAPGEGAPHGETSA